jgi:hypothetical protein
VREPLVRNCARCPFAALRLGATMWNWMEDLRC